MIYFPSENVSEDSVPFYFPFCSEFTFTFLRIPNSEFRIFFFSEFRILLRNMKYFPSENVSEDFVLILLFVFAEIRFTILRIPNSEFRILFFSEFTASYSAKALLLSFPYSQYREAPGRLRTAPPFRDRKSPYYRNSQHPYSVRFL